ncbi:ABC transporter permease protein [Candidatus Moduliflexus flocculans]|uniref:Transport permease protein n=1 Tax=Candidatus Moduliflexus flocculans TaxID=1499966 RepID=A0A0S6VT60_9BACT|nr:ABC transporter permease protein [Candidatus Moduliflexus flocculans]
MHATVTQYDEQPPFFTIEPTTGWGRLGLREIWEYRDLLYFLLWRDVKGRYKQMALGPLWIVIHPLLNMVIFSLVFGVVAKLPSNGVPYPIFTYTAILPWTFFASAVTGATHSLLSNSHLIAKVYFPRLIVPIVSVLAGVIDFSISFVILLGMMAYYGYFPGWKILTLPLFLLLAAAIGLAVGLWCATWVMHYRDVAQLVSYLVRGWMYVTPVVYAMSIIPERWQPLYRLNPMTNVIEGFRWALLDAGSPPDVFLVVSIIMIIPLLIGGAYYFRRTERTIVDVA